MDEYGAYRMGREDSAREIGLLASQAGLKVTNLDEKFEWGVAVAQVRTDGYYEGVAAERERQYELLLSCLPKDAENLSTMTPEQALKLVRKFVKLKPWDSK